MAKGNQDAEPHPGPSRNHPKASGYHAAAFAQPLVSCHSSPLGFGLRPHCVRLGAPGWHLLLEAAELALNRSRPSLGEAGLVQPHLMGEAGLTQPHLMGEAGLVQPHLMGEADLVQPHLMGEARLVQPHMMGEARLAQVMEVRLPKLAGRSAGRLGTHPWHQHGTSAGVLVSKP